MGTARYVTCKKGHKWLTTKDSEWFFLEFKDAGNVHYKLRACPLCFVQFIEKNVPTMVDKYDPAQQVQPSGSAGTPTGSAPSSDSDAAGNKG